MEVAIANRQRDYRLPRAGLVAATRAAARVGGLRGRSLSLAFVTAREMRRLNRSYLGHDYVTDVLSFPFEDGDPAGELIICPAFAARQARARGHSTRSELLLYAVHGTLHLAGLRDHRPRDVARMRAAERRALRLIGIAKDLWSEKP